MLLFSSRSFVFFHQHQGGKRVEVIRDRVCACDRQNINPPAMRSMQSLKLSLIALAMVQINGFICPHPSVSSRSVFLKSTPPKDNDGLGEVRNSEGEYSGDVDWDGEWKKVVASQGTGDVNRPIGNYKSDAEIAAIRATNKATEAAAKAASKVDVPSFDQLKGDWKVSSCGSFYKTCIHIYSSFPVLQTSLH